MKAIAVFPKEKKVKLIDHPEPNIISPTQIKLKIIEVGICGTDREICAFKYGTPPTGSDYLIIGHESLGQVVEVGNAVKNFRIGDLAVMMVRRPCSHASCVACRSGRQDFCYTGDFTERGIKEAHGFMTEYVVDDEQYCLSVPEKLRSIGVLTEPLTISEKAVREIFVIQKRLPWGKTASSEPLHALVIGAGPVGLLAALVFHQQQFKTFVYSLENENDMRARLATALGAQYVSAKKISTDRLAAHLSLELDVIFDGSGASQLAFQLFPLLRYNGVFVWTGIPGRKEPIDVNAGSLMRDIVLKNQSVFGSVNAGKDDFASAIDNLHALQILAKNFSLIKRYPVKDFETLLLAPPTADVFKSVLQFG